MTSPQEKPAEGASDYKIESNSFFTKWKNVLRKEFTVSVPLIPLKVAFFCYYAGSMSFVPFIPLHMKILGHNVEDIAIIAGITTVASLIGPFITGLIADKLGNYSVVLACNIFLVLLTLSGLLLVPPVPLNIQSLKYNCKPQAGTFDFTIIQSCFDNSTNVIRNLGSVEIQNCKYLCNNQPSNFTICQDSNTSLEQCTTLAFNETMKFDGKYLYDQKDDQLNLTFKSSSLYHCSVDCTVQCSVKGDFPNCLQEIPPRGKSFWLYLLLRFTSEIFSQSSFTILEASTLSAVQTHQSDFGKHRMISQLAVAFVPAIAGYIVDKHSVKIGEIDYMPAFYLGDAFFIIAIIFSFNLKIKNEGDREHLLKAFKHLVKNLEVFVFFALILMLGINYGFIETYLFVFLRDLNATNSLMGLTLTVGNLISIPFLLFSERIVNKIGRHNIFITTFICYFIRHTGYSLLFNPWYVFPFETLEIFTYQLMWVAAMTYCPILAPKELLATMTGFAGTMHYCIGRGMGSLIGGFMISDIGARNSFRVLAGISLLTGFCHAIYYHCYFKKKDSSSKDVIEGESPGINEDKM